VIHATAYKCNWTFRQHLHSKNSQITRCTNPEIKGPLLEGRVLAMVKEVMLDPAKLRECMDFFREDARRGLPSLPVEELAKQLFAAIGPVETKGAYLIVAEELFELIVALRRRRRLVAV
jgi:hypothetical protein